MVSCVYLPAIVTHPFIYIAALRRSGSTILSELLTDPPTSFIFREPNLGRRRFDTKPDDVELFRKYNIDLEAFAKRWSGWRKRWMIRGFREELMPQLAARFKQIGVKEIFNDHWRAYHRQFPQMKIIVLARDPRDLYLSIRERRRKGVNAAQGDVTPAEVSGHLNQQFALQRQMLETCDCLPITYETLCSDPTAFDKVRAFVQSPLATAGRAGRFNESNPVRQGEAAIHSGSITTNRVARWQKEQDPAAISESHQAMALMPDYNKFWGYA